jgi:hypothetical protein
MPFAKPAPFSAQEFWQKILTLANDNNGLPSRERVEQALGKKFAREAGTAPHQTLFLDYGKHWYFDAFYSMGVENSYLSIGFGQSGTHLFSDGQLLWEPTVAFALSFSGWERYRPSPHAGPESRWYSKPSAGIRLAVISNAITGLSLSWSLSQTDTSK